ncbi:MAG: MBL fold metallo-hydrolase, partial [Candidatus Magasanikbacteria bacterium]
MTRKYIHDKMVSSSLFLLVLFFFSGCSEVKIEEKIDTFRQERKSDEILINFLDVGQGDATFIEFENGEQLLLDCSIDARILESLGKNMDFSDRTLDYLFVTHPDKDHYGGCIDVLKRFEVKNIFYTGFAKQDDFYYEFENAITEEITEGAVYTEIGEPFSMNIVSSTLSFLYPDVPVDSIISLEANESSIVLRLDYGETSAIFMGDAEISVEEYLGETYPDSLDVDILKVGHHGSAGATGKEFLEQVTPQYAIISVGVENTYGHPSPRVLKKLERTGAKILRTDLEGDILFHINKT